MALLEEAHARGADMLLVHHGYFWRGEDERVVGIKRARLKFLLDHDINLLAYHLPLDAHPEFGNNIQLGHLMGIPVDGWAGEQNIVAYGHLQTPMELGLFCEVLGEQLKRPPMFVGDATKLVKHVAWCTGAAQGYMEEAIRLGVDVYISGEISEQTVHLARESGVAYVAAGHHATERFGVKALVQHLAGYFSLQHEFVDIDNPV